MISELRELYRYRELLLSLIARDLKVRYKRSALGFLWSLINPIMQTLVITVVFKFVLRLDIPNYSVWVLAAILPWTFFQNSILDAAQSILIHFSLLKKVYLPREIIPLTTVISNLIHLGLSLLVFFAYATIYPIYFSGRWVPPPYFGAMLLWLPVVVFFNFLLNAGLALFVSAMNVYYEDVKFIVQILVNLLFYACPIVYPSARISDGSGSWVASHLYFLYRLNPVASLIIAYQKVLMCNAAPADPRPLDPRILAITALECIVIAAWGYSFYNRRKWEFAERL
jgi:ABC-type polysaccharide/polyol phosphate export permease